MTDRPTTAAAETSAADTGPLSAGQVKALKVAIVVMGALIVIGILVIIGRIFYLAGKPKPGDTSRAVAMPVAAARLALPAGASVRHIALDGGRLAVHYEGPTGAGIKLIDLATGSEVSHIRIEPAVPAR